jgi:hypothetical protein
MGVRQTVAFSVLVALGLSGEEVVGPVVREGKEGHWMTRRNRVLSLFQAQHTACTCTLQYTNDFVRLCTEHMLDEAFSLQASKL